MYTTPLMGFIDEACVVFDGEDENKFEHTTIHEKFKELVERLLTDFLSEMGISVDQFSEVIQRSEHADLNEFVLASILTVDDFLQFKSMMVRRNVDLTNEVLEAHNKGKARERNARAIAIQESPSRGTRGGPVTDAAPGSGPTTPDPPPPAALVRHADPGMDDDGFHLGAVEQALKASKEQHERDERERRRLDRLAASEEAAQEAMAMRESAALAAQAQGGTANDDAADDSPPSPTSSEGSLTDDADALAAAIQASEKSTVTDEERRAEMDSYAIVEEKRKALAEALAELKSAEDAAKEVKIASGTPKPKRVSVASMFHGAKIPAMEELRRRRDEFYARRKAAREAYAEEAHRNAEATQQRMAALVAAREAEAKAEEDAVRARDEEEAERVRRIESEEDAELRAALEASAAEDAAKQSALSSAEAQEAAAMEAATAASLAADAEAKKSASSFDDTAQFQMDTRIQASYRPGAAPLGELGGVVGGAVVAAAISIGVGRSSLGVTGRGSNATHVDRSGGVVRPASASNLLSWNLAQFPVGRIRAARSKDGSQNLYYGVSANKSCNLAACQGLECALQIQPNAAVAKNIYVRVLLIREGSVEAPLSTHCVRQAANGCLRVDLCSISRLCYRDRGDVARGTH